MIRRKPFYDEADTGGSSPATTPPAETPASTGEAAQAATQTAEHVAEAATSASEAAASTGEDGWKVVADELKGLRGDIGKLLKQSASPAAAATSQPKPATSGAAVQVAAPEKKYKTVWRNGRRVKREVKA